MLVPAIIISWAYLLKLRLGFQVLWTPVNEDSAYTTDDLARDYPRMKALHMQSQGPRTVVYISREGEESLEEEGESFADD